MRALIALVLLAQWSAVNSGATVPAQCRVGDVYITTTVPTLNVCNVTNVWTPVMVFSDGGAVWGGITGVLATQTDLQTALNAKGTSNFDGVYASLTGKPTLGTAAATAIGDYATAAQGTTANSALQPAGNGSTLTGLTKTQVGLANADNTSDANKPVSGATQTALNLKANLASPTFTGTVTLPASTALTTPVIGAATGTSLAVTGAITSSSATAGIGYVVGSGGAQTQATNKATTVASNTITTAITMNAAALAAGAIVSFTFTNSTIAALDQVICTHQSAGTNGAYLVNARPAAGSASIAVRNTTAGSLSEAIVLRCSVYKAVSS